MFWSICTLESIYCSRNFLGNTAVWYTPTQCSCLCFKYAGLQVLEQKAVKYHQICLPMSALINGDLLCGARTVGLVIRGFMQSHVSTQTVEYPSFCFPADLVFQEGASICVNGAYSSLLICELLCLHFACAQNWWTLSAPSVCTFYCAWLCEWIIFRVLTFC